MNWHNKVKSEEIYIDKKNQENLSPLNDFDEHQISFDFE